MSDVKWADILNADGTVNPDLLHAAAQRGRMEMNARDSEKAFKLWGAGWTAETPHTTQSDIMSYYWRRPPKGGRKKGRLFLSTDQAYNNFKSDS